MLELARRVLDIMLFRRGPQDLPADGTSLLASAAAYCILLAVQIALVAPAGHAVIQALIAAVLLVFYVRAVLRLREVSNRFAQTATALFACGSVLTLIMLAPTHAMAGYLHALGAAADPRGVPMPPSLLSLTYIALGLWGLAINTHIYRHALDVGVWLGFGAAISYEVLLLFVFQLLG